MALTSPQRETGWYWLARHMAASGSPPAKFTKAELRTALDAAVTWIEANQAGYVSGLAGTAFAGAASTADEKRRLFLAAFHALYDVEFG